MQEPEGVPLGDRASELPVPTRRLRAKTSVTSTAAATPECLQPLPEEIESAPPPASRKRKAEVPTTELSHEDEPEDIEMMTLVKSLGYDEAAWKECLKLVDDTTMVDMLSHEMDKHEEDSPEEESWMRMENGIDFLPSGEVKAAEVKEMEGLWTP